MNTKQAIKNLNAMKMNYDQRDKKSIPIQTIDKAIEALEKQIPKKPNDISTYEGWIVKGEEGYFFGACPFCKNHVIMFQKICDCGQKLNWEEI